MVRETFKRRRSAFLLNSSAPLASMQQWLVWSCIHIWGWKCAWSTALAWYRAQLSSETAQPPQNLISASSSAFWGVKEQHPAPVVLENWNASSRKSQLASLPSQSLVPGPAACQVSAYGVFFFRMRTLFYHGGSTVEHKLRENSSHTSLLGRWGGTWGGKSAPLVLPKTMAMTCAGADPVQAG